MPAERVAFSTRPDGTVNTRTIGILAERLGSREVVLDSPVLVTGTGSRHLGKEGHTSRDSALAMAALIHAAGARKDVLLRIGDADGGDRLLIAASRRLGWLQPKIFRADWGAWCSCCYPLGNSPGHRRTHKSGDGTYCPIAGMIRNSKIVGASPLSHRGVALFQAGQKNAGTLDCATKMRRAGIHLTCWCDECGPTVPLTGPCREHSRPSVLERWQEETFARPAA